MDYSSQHLEIQAIQCFIFVAVQLTVVLDLDKRVQDHRDEHVEREDDHDDKQGDQKQRHQPAGAQQLLELAPTQHGHEHVANRAQHIPVVGEFWLEQHEESLERFLFRSAAFIQKMQEIQFKFKK